MMPTQAISGQNNPEDDAINSTGVNRPVNALVFAMAASDDREINLDARTPTILPSQEWHYVALAGVE